MLAVRNINIEHREKIFEELKQFIAKLRRKFSISEIYLFGSFATGEIHEGSDIDLLVVGDFRGKMFERILEITRLTDLPIEPLVYTPEEFDRMKRSSPLVENILKTGKKM